MDLVKSEINKYAVVQFMSNMCMLQWMYLDLLAHVLLKSCINITK